MGVRTPWQTLCAVAAAGRAAPALVLPFFLLFACLLIHASPARALEPIVVDASRDSMDITVRGELYEGRGDRLQVETAPGPDGIAGRMAVQATTPGTNPNWFVFALKNPTSERIVRELVARRYATVGSGVFWPDLDSARVASITPSLGYRPDRVADDQADIFRLSVEPGATVTFVAELSGINMPRLTLWNGQVHDRKARDRMLFDGIMLGIAGLLAIFLTSVFAANHKAIFPAAALVAWSALAVFCVDFGFWHKLFQLNVEDNALYRAASEAALAASVVVFLYTFLRMGLWHGWIRLAFAAWIFGQLALIPLAVIDPRLASGLARASFLLIGGIGTPLIIFLAVRGQERALSIVPTWLLLLVWIFAAAMVVTGKLTGDVVVSGLVSGLVLLLVLLGFTVTQYAFRTGDALYGAPSTELRLHSLAVEGSGASVWEWDMRSDEVQAGPELEVGLGLPGGMMTTSLDEWLQHVHPADRERIRIMLWSVQEREEGEITADMRLRRADGSYLWYELRARAADGSTGRRPKCVGLIRDITSTKRTQERLLHDAVHDSLTGLPNRELFLDRVAGAVTRAKEGDGRRPTVMFIDIDRFKNVNRSLGLVVGDSMLLTLARRLARHLNPQDTLARVGGDQFAILLVSGADPSKIAMLAERVRRSLRSPMRISGKEIILTGSIGIAVYDDQPNHQELLKEAEIAMLRAKRAGTDHVELFQPGMRAEEKDRLPLESDLRRAIERQQIKVLYQPITRLADNALAGFEALVRWDHPKLGRLNPEDFVPIAEDTGLIGELGTYVLEQAVEQAIRWQKALPRPGDPLYVSVNVSSRQLFRQDLTQQIRLILARQALPKGTLRLEITESLVMENPERAVELLNWLQTYGARLSLDDFGTGYSSLSYLQRFPFDTIKVDKSLVRHADGNGSVPVILKSIVAMVHELGKEVVAEGVEFVEDANYLRSIGCEYAQGFFYGEAMSDKDVLTLLSALAKSGQGAPRGDNVRQVVPKPVKPAAAPKALPPAIKPVTSTGTG